ncbi:uncharacterized protein F5147DRAFT_582938 [Suillus discolor]|uniref:Uncharacterized protein n=1 Tax=Suillus discolor TaxID=1912936 RepID=A0A9P7EYT4_9AGAM|nr:uncharacterized protein F5147DRAFT_582938 [Suillus discolor]KAG2098718.1 hypothetical protein F5147DRAFT_582938 [Suillus discolor]
MALVADPTLEVMPDFAGVLYNSIREDLAAATNQTKEQVAARLERAWRDGNNVRVAEWNQHHDEEAQAAADAERARAAQEEAERMQHETEAEKERLEAEKKKPKMNGFDEASSVGDFLNPHPMQYAIQKLTNFEYIELWYFSPDGCKDALRSSRSIAENDLSIVRVDDQLALRPSSAFKASKAVIADHELPFSIFLWAKNLFLVQISKAKWPQSHIDALSLFFWHLENHSIWNNSDIGDLVILTYTSRVRQDWHDRLKWDEGFNIGNINENLLRTINEELWDKVRSRTWNNVRTQFQTHNEHILNKPFPSKLHIPQQNHKPLLITTISP